MKVRILLLGLTLLTTAAVAEEVAYNGRTLEVAADQDARPIQRVQGSRYAISLSPADTITKAQGCLAAQNGVTVVSADPASGQLQALAEFAYRARFTNHTVQSQWQLVATDGGFQITESALTVTTPGGDGGSKPLAQQEAGWEKSLDALIAGENALVDCLYR
ncbi:MAG: hypothetical protein KGL91_02285 [Xanthomonadaceae bacterium]|nr:hypothetical protein [Xanthomonadaceae bacterium]